MEWETFATIMEALLATLHGFTTFMQVSMLTADASRAASVFARLACLQPLFSQLLSCSCRFRTVDSRQVCVPT